MRKGQKSKPQPGQSGTSGSKSPPEKLKSDDVTLWTDMANSIGSGASSTVYKGFYRGKDVAVKVYKDNSNLSRKLWEVNYYIKFQNRELLLISLTLK